MTKVWNKRDPKCPKDAKYVGRPTILGNPFSHLPHSQAKFQVATREEAVSKFREYAQDRVQWDEAFKREVLLCRERDLVCWCAPALCHGTVLHELAVELSESQL